MKLSSQLNMSMKHYYCNPYPMTSYGSYCRPYIRSVDIKLLAHIQQLIQVYDIGRYQAILGPRLGETYCKHFAQVLHTNDYSRRINDWHSGGMKQPTYNSLSSILFIFIMGRLAVALMKSCLKPQQLYSHLEVHQYFIFDLINIHIGLWSL